MQVFAAAHPRLTDVSEPATLCHQVSQVLPDDSNLDFFTLGQTLEVVPSELTAQSLLYSSSPSMAYHAFSVAPAFEALLDHPLTLSP